MSNLILLPTRRILPRWFDSAKTVTNVEAGSVRVVDPATVDAGTADDIEDDWREWEAIPTIGRGSDLLNWPDHIFGGERRRQVYEFVSSRAESAGVREIASNDLISVTDRPNVRSIRCGLSIFPKNSLGCLDMARHRVQLGGARNLQKAERYVRTALQLAPGHRLVVRAASRFFVHVGKADVALDTIRRALREGMDPWLLSAEIACADIVGRAPAHWKRVKQCIEGGTYRPEHLSELCTAAGGLELSAGERKRAKRLFERALIKPNENVLAQILVTSRQEQLPLAIDERSDYLQASEPRLWQEFLFKHDPTAALTACNQWLGLEPFSGRPYVMGSYLAALIGDFSASAEIARRGMRVEPKDLTLAGNYYFARLSSEEFGGGVSGDDFLDDFARWLRAALAESRPAADRVQAIANFGLYLYRTDDFEKGRSVYEHAVKFAEKSGNRALALAARAMQARESIRSRTPWADDVLREAVSEKNYQVDVGASFVIDGLKGTQIEPTPISSQPRPIGEVKFTLEDGQATIWLPKERKQSPIWRP